MPKRKPHRPSKPAIKAVTPSLPPYLREGLIEAEELIDDREWREAADLLGELNQRYPRRTPVLSLLLEVWQELNDVPRCLTVAEQLLKITPDDAAMTLFVATMYVMNSYLALSLPVFQRFQERWPEHERAAGARSLSAAAETDLRAQCAGIGLSGGDALELAMLHEQTRRLVELGEYADARKAARKLLARQPQFAPALNNISQSYFAEGRLDQAIATAQSVLEFDPDNVHALSNAARYCCLSGRMDEARQFADKLQASRAEAADRSYKIAEGLTYLGDDADVLEVVSQSPSRKTPVDALLCHLAAVASLRQGQEEEARHFWNEALAISPALAVAQENVDDLTRPVGDREGPWAFSLENWVPGRTITDLIGHLDRLAHGNSDEALAHEARSFLRRHPEMVPLVPLLLDRGDPRGRGFALALAGMAATPEMLAALRDFALGGRGPDSLRMRAAQTVREAGLLSGMVRLRLKGEWQDLQFREYEIHEEPLHSHAPEVEDLIVEAVELLREAEAGAAERLLLRARTMEPDAPDILNNLATAYQQQGRSQESRLLLERLHEQHPDYLFAAANLASHAARDGRVQEARALLAPFLSRTRLHRSELASLCSAQIELALAEGNLESAQILFSLWEGLDPDHPLLDYFEDRIESGSARPALSSFRKAR